MFNDNRILEVQRDAKRWKVISIILSIVLFFVSIGVGWLLIILL